MKPLIPYETIARADALMTMAMQSTLIQRLTGLKPEMQTPEVICALILGIKPRNSRGKKK